MQNSANISVTIHKDISLKPYNTFGIEARAKYLAEVTNITQVREIISQPELNKLPVLILGGGSNLLFTQDFEGLVIKNNLKGIEVLKEDNNYVWVRAAAGENWHEFVLWCIEHGYAGVENLSLIPGCVGAAPMQNIGAYGVEIKDVFDSVQFVMLATGEVLNYTAEQCQFGYRESVFKHGLKNKVFIASVTLKLNKSPNFNITYGDIQKTLAEMNLSELNIKAVSDAVIKIRQSKLPNPAELGNSGSFFKNPEIPTPQFEELQKQFPEIKGYPLPRNKTKVPAGWLIEQCGWKGKVVGNTGSHKMQALVLVNYGGATGNEVKELAYAIIDSVKEKFGIELHPEVNII